MNEKYFKKYQLLKRRVKDMIFKNAALCDHLSQMQDNVTRALEEQKFLMNRCSYYDPECALPENFIEKKTPVRKKSQEARVKPNKVAGENGRGASSAPFTPSHHKVKPETIIEPLPPQPEVKPEPLEQENILDQSEITEGGVSYAIGNLIVQNLGEIDAERPNFHTSHMVYPVGYVSCRPWGSMTNPFLKSLYTCRITEAAGNPRFEMSSEADPDVMIVGPSAQFCHSTLLRYMQDTHGLRLSSVAPDGDWFFGLSHPLVMGLLENLPNLGACEKFLGFEKEERESVVNEKEMDPGINFESFMQLVDQPTEEVLYHEEIREEQVE